MNRNDNLYTVDNAKRFGWASVSGHLDQERLNFLRCNLAGKKVLDVGCGGGAYVEQLRRDGFEAVGVDRSADFLQIARDRSDRLGEYVQGDILALPFADKSFDTVFCFDVLEHVDDEAALQELIRVAKRRILVAVPKTDETFPEFGLCFSHYQDFTHLRTYTVASLQTLLIENSPSGSQIQIKTEGRVLLNEMINNLIAPRRYKRIWARPAEPFIRHIVRLLSPYVGFRGVPTGLQATIDLP